MLAHPTSGPRVAALILIPGRIRPPPCRLARALIHRAVETDTKVCGMRIGFGLPVAGAWAHPHTIAQLGRRAEDLGYDSLWTFQRLLVAADDEPAPVYRSVLDPMISLAF